MTQQTLTPPQQKIEAPTLPRVQQPIHHQQRPVPMPMPAPQLAAAQPEQEVPTIWGPLFSSFLLGALVGGVAIWKLSGNKYFRAFQNADRYED